MHAVVLIVTVPNADAAAAALRDQVAPQVSGTPGFVAGYWIRLDAGRGTAVVVFESEDAARSAAVGVRAFVCQRHAVSDEGHRPDLGLPSAVGEGQVLEQSLVPVRGQAAKNAEREIDPVRLTTTERDGGGRCGCQDA